MLSPFGVGIELPPFARHLSSLAKGMQQGSPHKFVFWPTCLTAKQVFGVMESEFRENIFLWGSPGIAKTTSIVLYLHLYNYITRFVFEAQSDATKMKELRELQRLQLLKTRTFKYFFWSMQESDSLKKKLIEELIIEQATELNEATRNALKNELDPLNFGRLLH